ncbi:MAG: cytochrome c oxidase subunit I [Gemmatimonadaceae bacterium]|nr:cytochrome c oxidase subunit I [Gemmatimonadaceae bacterium]
MASIAARLDEEWRTPHSLYGELSTVDHKKIGKRYLVTAFVFLIIGGLEAALMRAQLIGPNERWLSPDQYNQLFTMHGTTMIFWYASPVLSGFSNYLWPLMLGSRDMAFPRVNALSYWTFLFSGLFLYTSLFLGQMPDRGWFAYAPLTELQYSPALNMDFYALGLLFLTISTTIGAINFVATAFSVRAPGMSINRLPIFIWSTLTTSFSMIFALPALSVACVYLWFDRRLGMHFFDPAQGGSAMLWQHLFWVFGHPWVYIIVLPAMGIASMVIPTFCRRPIAGYTYVALATVSTGVLGFGVWVHHMFATGLPPLSMTFFSGASMTIVIPSAVSLFAWLATLWGSKPVIRTPMLFMLGFICLFVIGGLSGVATAVVPYDWQLTDTYFIVAHIHYVLIGINLFPVIGGLYYWFPKMTGRMLDERLGRWNFWVMFIGMNVGFFPMHIAGLLGMPRRIYTYDGSMGWNTVNLVTSLGAYLFAIGVLMFVWNVIKSRVRGAIAAGNPWDASTLEWSTSSPPPEYNFEVIPTVRSRDPLWEDRLEPPEQSSLREGPTLTDGRLTVQSAPLDADRVRLLHMSEDTLLPLIVALVMLALFYALLFRIWGLALAAAVMLGVATAWWLWPQHPEHGEG